jgi:hypothetical protein
MNRNDSLELLGLSETEKKIIEVTSGIAKTTAQVARHAELPRSTAVYVLNKLLIKNYITQTMWDKKKVWRSNIPKILQYIQNNEKKC